MTFRSFSLWVGVVCSLACSRAREGTPDEGARPPTPEVSGASTAPSAPLPDAYSGPQIPGQSCCCQTTTGSTFTCDVTSVPGCGMVLRDSQWVRQTDHPARCLAEAELKDALARHKANQLGEQDIHWEGCLTTCGMLENPNVEE